MTEPTLKASGAAHRDDGPDGMDAARAARVRRNAWLLGGCAALVYLGYIVWMFLHAAGG